jgi:hypothetical protein
MRGNIVQHCAILCNMYRYGIKLVQVLTFILCSHWLWLGHWQRLRILLLIELYKGGETGLENLVLDVLQYNGQPVMVCKSCQCKTLWNCYVAKGLVWIFWRWWFLRSRNMSHYSVPFFKQGCVSLLYWNLWFGANGELAHRKFVAVRATRMVSSSKV